MGDEKKAASKERAEERKKSSKFVEVERRDLPEKWIEVMTTLAAFDHGCQ